MTYPSGEQPGPLYQPQGQPYQPQGDPYGPPAGPQYPPPQQQGYPPYPQGYGTNERPTRLRGRTPLRVGFVFAGIAVVLFVIGGVVLANKSLGQVNGFHRVSFASQGGVVNLSGSGKWVGYYEAANVTNSINRIPDFRVAVRGPSGQPIQVQHYGNSTTGTIKKLVYNYNGHNGVAAFQFTAPEAGQYRIVLVRGPTIPADAGVAIGRDILGGTIAGGLLIVGGVVAIIVAVVLIIVGLVKRSRHKRELRNAAPAYGGAPPGYGYPPPGQGGWQPPPQ